jgi:hypothetical protein
MRANQPERPVGRAKSNSHLPVVPAGDSVWFIPYRWQRSTTSLAYTTIRVAVIVVVKGGFKALAEEGKFFTTHNTIVHYCQRPRSDLESSI